ncbi:MAG: MBL fold metallo-hydrolase [Saprospiraceae bacterium]
MRIHTIDLGFLGHSEAIAAFVVETAEGPVLIECGPYSTFPALRAALQTLGYEPADIRRLFLTHIHFDHAGAAWALAEAGTPVLTHPAGAPHLAAPERLYNSARKIYGDDMDRLWGEMRPIVPERLHAPTHGEEIRIGDCVFTAWHTPGHAKHHIAWQVRGADGADALFTGDVAGVRIHGGPPVPPCPPPDIDVEAWKDSIALMRGLSASVYYLTHYGAVDAPAAHLDALERTLDALVEWVRPYAERDTPPEEILPLFRAFSKELLREQGVNEADMARYEAANPSFMSVAGLLRYFKTRP